MAGSEVDAPSATLPTASSVEGSLSEDVVTKITTAGSIVNSALKQVLSLAVPGADILKLCQMGDSSVSDSLSKVYNKKEKGKKIEKGIAFPTTICVNDCISNFSPSDSESSSTLQEGDILKVEVGAHIDGYACISGCSSICCETAALAATNTSDQTSYSAENVKNPDLWCGRKADLLKAVWIASEAAVRTMKEGKKSSDVTKVIEQVLKEFGCLPIEGTFSYEMKKHVIEGTKVFANSTTTALDEKLDDFEFHQGDVYSLNIKASLGEGRYKEMDVRPMIYRRAVDKKYILKSSLGRLFMSQVEANSPTFPFSLRLLDIRGSKVGVAEAMRHELLRSYPVLVDKNGDLTATSVSTVIILPSGPKRICSIPFFLESLLKPTREIQNLDLKALLSTSMNKKKQKNKEKRSGDDLEVKE